MKKNTRFILFLHYPPTNILERRSGFTYMAEEYGAEQVIYAHGQSRYHYSIEGRFHGVEYRLVSDNFWFGMLKYPQKKAL